MDHFELSWLHKKAMDAYAEALGEVSRSKLVYGFAGDKLMDRLEFAASELARIEAQLLTLGKPRQVGPPKLKVIEGGKK